MTDKEIYINYLQGINVKTSTIITESYFGELVDLSGDGILITVKAKTSNGGYWDYIYPLNIVIEKIRTKTWTIDNNVLRRIKLKYLRND
jgi:hypothetical protein